MSARVFVRTKFAQSDTALEKPHRCSVQLQNDYCCCCSCCSECIWHVEKKRYAEVVLFALLCFLIGNAWCNRGVIKAARVSSRWAKEMRY